MQLCLQKSLSAFVQTGGVARTGIEPVFPP